MNRGWLGGGLFVLVVGLATSSDASAQALSSASSPDLSTAALTEAQYDAGGPSGQTGGYTVTTTCTGTGSADCRLFIQYGSNPQGQQIGMQWALSSATAECQSIPAIGVFSDIVPTSAALTTKKNQTCVATFVFRVSPVAYTTYTAPGPISGAYQQEVRLVLTRP